MNEIIEKWIRKAENDFKIGKDELNTEEPATDMICFHMEQCVEKYLKAYLVLKGQSFRKTHDISELIELCEKVDKIFEQLYQLKADKLTRYAIDVRYPEEFYIPTLKEARECVEIATKVKNFVKQKFTGKGHKLP
jgi:HEPN domain-containing protein